MTATQRSAVIERAMSTAARKLYGATMRMMNSREVARIFAASVTAVSDPVPHVRRLTIMAPEFGDLQRLGADEYIGLFMPAAGVDLVLPSPHGLNVRAQLEKLDEAVRPQLRWYTIRYHRPELCEIDIDIVIHADGPGGEYLHRVQPGDVVGIREGEGGHPGVGGRQLLVGDETAAPAISAILESLGGQVDDITVYLEVPGDGDVAPIDSPAPITMVTRSGAPGAALLAALTASPPQAYDFVWICGEQKMSADGRRLLVEHGTHKRDILFSAYWRLGKARP